MKTIKKSVAILLSILMLLSVMAVGVTASADETTTVYFVNTNGWEQVAVYAWGGANAEIAGQWPGTVVTEANGVYSYDIQDSTHVIFNDNNGSQTANLEAWEAVGKYYEPKTAKFYDTAQEAIDASNGPIEKTYTVAGTAGLCGSEWNPADANNDMEYNGNGIYTKVYTYVQAGTYKFKVAENHSWKVSHGDPDGPEGNFEVRVLIPSNTVTITFNEATGLISYKIGTEAASGTAYFVNTFGWEQVAAQVWHSYAGMESCNGAQGQLATVVDKDKGVYSFTFSTRTHIYFKEYSFVGVSCTGGLRAVDAVDKYYEPKTARFYDTAQEAIDAANAFDLKTYTIVGYINGVDVGCQNDWETVVEAYNFVDGKATITFNQDSYVFVKTTDNANWYMTNVFCTETSATLFNTNTGAGEKMFVPAGTVEFTLVENADDSLNISYAPVRELPSESQPTETQPATKAPTLNAKSKNLNAGQTFAIKVKDTNGEKVTYTSDKLKVATVSKTGVVTALTKGTAKINVKVGTKTLTCTINVKTDPKLQNNTITVGKGKKATVKVIGAVAKPTVSKCNIAKITPSKTQLAIKANNKKGSQKVTVTVNGKKLKLTVKVK